LHSALRRLPVYLLALMPVVWGNCPYWFVGAPGAKKASRAAEPRCPCCRRKAESTGGPADPFDCRDCPMLVARNGSAPAPAPTALPDARNAGAFVAVIAVPPTGLGLVPATLSPRGAAGPPTGPPGGFVSPLLDEVSLRI
jgi:hypothetical protein